LLNLATSPIIEGETVSVANSEVSIRRCEWLLKQRGYRYWREDDIGQVLPLKQSRPDFLVETPSGVRFFLEAKSFEKETILHKIKARVFSLGHMALQKRVQRLVKDAAEQIQEYASYGLPMVVALDNYRQVGVHLDDHSLGSLFGELEVVHTPDTMTGRAVDTRWERKDDNSPLYGGRNAHISTVVGIISGERFDTFEKADDFTVERPMKVRIIRSPFATVPLPPELFSDASDEEIK